jgi:hypothetical protein
VYIAADGRVGSHNFLALRLVGLWVCHVEVGGEGNVLANGQSEDRLFRGQLEAVDGRVVGRLCLAGDGKLGEGRWRDADIGVGRRSWCFANFACGRLGRRRWLWKEEVIVSLVERVSIAVG